MTLPFDPDARNFYRLGLQRLDEAELLLELGRAATAMYLAGYAIECMLKSLLINITPKSKRPQMLLSLKRDFGHNIVILYEGLIERHVVPPSTIRQKLILVSDWSPEMRYRPGLGDRGEAEQFLAAVRAVLEWAKGKI